MLLSSPEKLSFYTGKDINVDGTQGTVSKAQALSNKRNLIQWRSSISHSISHFIGRELLVQERTEYFDTQYRQLAYFPKAIPVASIASVYTDFTGQYSGGETELEANTDYIIGVDGSSIVLTIPALQSSKGLRVIYTGGLAYHPVNSTFTISGIAGTPTTTFYAYGEMSESVGRVVSWTALTNTLVIANLYGIFEEGETLAFQTIPGDTDSNISGVSGTISAITRQSIAEAYPDLERAVEIETRFMFQHAHDFENTTSDTSANTNRRQSPAYQSILPFQPETIAILERYRRLTL